MQSSLHRALDRISFGFPAPRLSEIAAHVLSRVPVTPLNCLLDVESSASSCAERSTFCSFVDTGVLDYTADGHEAAEFRLLTWPLGLIASRLIVPGYPRAADYCVNSRVLAVASSNSCTTFECNISLTRFPQPSDDRHDVDQFYPEAQGGLIAGEEADGSSAGRVRGVAVGSENGISVTVAGDDVKLFNTETNGSLTPVCSFRSSDDAVVLAVTALTGPCVAGMTESGLAHLWDARTGNSSPVWKARAGHAFADNTVAAIRLSADYTRRIYTSAEVGTEHALACWDARAAKGPDIPVVSYTGMPPSRFEWCYNSPFHRVFDVDETDHVGLFAASAADGSVVCLWDAARGGTPLQRIAVPSSTVAHPRRVQFAASRPFLSDERHPPGLWVETADSLYIINSASQPSAG